MAVKAVKDEEFKESKTLEFRILSKGEKLEQLFNLSKAIDNLNEKIEEFKSKTKALKAEIDILEMEKRFLMCEIEFGQTTFGT